MTADIELSASELSSLLGYHGERSQAKAMRRVWQHSSLKESAPEWKMNSVMRDEEQLHIAQLRVADAWRELLNCARGCDNHAQMCDVVRRAYHVLFESLVPEKFEEPQNANPQQLMDAIYLHVSKFPHPGVLCSQRLFSRLRQILCVNYGIRGERLFRTLHNRVSQQPIFELNKRLRRALPADLLPGSGLTWAIDGRVDGLRANRIIEIKHRVGLLGEVVGISDLLQLHAYMFLLEHTQATLIQCVRLPEGVFSKETVVPFNLDFWQDTVHGLARCVMFMYQIHSHPLARECFALLDDDARVKLLNKHMQPTPVQAVQPGKEEEWEDSEPV